MNLKILGCVSPCPTIENNCPGYLITIGDQKILLDAGTGITRLLKFPEILENLTIIISHFHRDHYLDLYNIIFAAKEFKFKGIFNGKINVLMPRTPEHITNDIFNDGKSVLDITYYDQNTNYNITNEIKLNFIEVEHIKWLPTYATRINYNEKALVYTGDTNSSISNLNNLIPFSMNADVIICDSKLLKLRNEENDNCHMTAYEAANYALKSNAKKLVLTHFSSFGYNEFDYITEAKSLFSDSLTAQSNMEINI
jgi:ribonuclease BN (tRNA processing enzyme)